MISLPFSAYPTFSRPVSRSPSFLTLISLRYSLRADEPQKLLLHAGYAQIYDWVPRDSILFYALDNGMSLVACNQQLDERGEAILG